MAMIKEQLYLEDRFSNPFERYIRLAERAAGSTAMVQAALNQMAVASEASCQNMVNTMTSAMNQMQKMASEPVPMAQAQQEIVQRFVPAQVQTPQDIVQSITQQVIPAQPQAVQDMMQSIRQQIIPAQPQIIQDAAQRVSQQIIPAQIQVPQDMVQTISQQLIPAQIPTVQPMVQAVSQQVIPGQLVEPEPVRQMIQQQVNPALIPSPNPMVQSVQQQITPAQAPQLPTDGIDRFAQSIQATQQQISQTQQVASQMGQAATNAFNGAENAVEQMLRTQNQMSQSIAEAENAFGQMGHTAVDSFGMAGRTVEQFSHTAQPLEDSFNRSAQIVQAAMTQTQAVTDDMIQATKAAIEQYNRTLGSTESSTKQVNAATKAARQQMKLLGDMYKTNAANAKAFEAEQRAQAAASNAFTASIAEQAAILNKATAEQKLAIQQANAAAAAERERIAQINAATAAEKLAMQQLRRTAQEQQFAAQQARIAAQEVENFARAQQIAATSTNALINRIQNLIGTFVGVQGIGSLFTMSDSIAQTTARLNMMNDGQQRTEQLNRMIFQSAMDSRGAYQKTADMVSKLGTLAGGAFSSSAEIVAFVEQINKQLGLSGTPIVDAQGAMLQLTQAMASGVLRGEELNSILEQTPMIAQSIATYMGVTTGTMRNLASEGYVTAEVVKNAMFYMAEETNEAFQNMPMTWAQVWTQAQNIAVMTLNPVLTAINWLANNIETVGPVVLSVAGAFAVFQIAAHSTRIATAATGAYTAALSILKFGMAVLSGQQTVTTAATAAFNGTLLASPITWWVMGIMLAAGAIYTVVAAVNYFTGSTISATGVITGIISVAAAFILNTAIGLLNGILYYIETIFINPFIGVIEFILNVTNGGFDSFGDGVANLIGNIISWFLGLGAVVTTIIDSIFGTDWTAGLNALQSKVLSWGKNENAVTLDRMSTKLEYRFDYGKAWDSGYDWGANFNLANLFTGWMPELTSPTVPEIPDWRPDLGGIEKSVGNIEKSVTMSDEELKSLVDLAERRYVNQINLTTQAPVIQVTGQNVGSTAADRQNLSNVLRDMLMEQIAAGSTRSVVLP